MECKAGRILLLISGILTLVAAFVLLIIIVFVTFYIGELNGTEGNQGLLIFIFLLLFVVMIAAGILKLYSASMMRGPESRRVVNGGIMGLICGVLTGGDLLAIIGGILAIVQGGEK